MNLPGYFCGITGFNSEKKRIQWYNRKNEFQEWVQRKAMLQKNRSGRKSTGSVKTKRKSVSKSKTSAAHRKTSAGKSRKNSRVRQRNLRMLLICIILMVGVSIGCWYGINNVQEREEKSRRYFWGRKIQEVVLSSGRKKGLPILMWSC